MSELFRILSSACEGGMDEYRKKYLSSIKDVFPVITAPSLLRSHIRTAEREVAESLLRFSLVFNELSLFTLVGGKNLSVILLQPEWFNINFGIPGASLTISIDRLQELGLEPDNPKISPAFIFPSGDYADEIIVKLRPFIESGKLLIQPERSLFYEKNELNEKGGRDLAAIATTQFSPLDDWEIVDEQLARPIPMSFDNNDHLNQELMFEITIPYLDGVGFHDLSKILDDEGDLVSGLRSSIKQAIEQCGDAPDPRIVARDIIDPKVDALNRRFKSIVNSHAFRVAGAGVGTVVLAYTAVATSGLSSAIATACGSGGFGLLGREYSAYRDKLNELKNDPHYFLWRCKNVAKKT